jgi:hypothetical protein
VLIEVDNIAQPVKVFTKAVVLRQSPPLILINEAVDLQCPPLLTQ